MNNKLLSITLSVLITVLSIWALMLTSCSGEEAYSPETESHTAATEPVSESESVAAVEEIEYTTIPDYTPYDEDRDYILLDADCIYQNDYELYNGCEVVSAATVLNYYGFDVEPDYLFDNYMPSGEYGEVNPFEYYVGNPYIEWDGCGCYAPCVVETVNGYLSDMESSLECTDVSGSSMGKFRELLKSGYPVIIWGTVNMEPTWVMDCWYFNDEYINWYDGSHCVVLVGFEGREFIVSDPLEGIVRYSFKDIRAAYNLVYSQACIIK